MNKKLIFEKYGNKKPIAVKETYNDYELELITTLANEKRNL